MRLGMMFLAVRRNMLMYRVSFFLSAQVFDRVGETLSG